MKKLKSIRLDTDLITAIEKQSLKENRNFSNMLETMAKKYLERYE